MTLVAATFDPANKGSNMTLSGGSLTATITSGSGVARSTRAIAATVYFEVATSGSYSGTPRVGLSQSRGQSQQQPRDRLLRHRVRSGGNVYIDGSVVATIATWSAGANIGVAVDPLHQEIWFRVNGGNWNNSGAADPGV